MYRIIPHFFLAAVVLFAITQLIITSAKGTEPPVLGVYPDTSVAVSGNTVVSPSALPVNAVGITASTTPNFNGEIAVDVETGVLHITNAYPAGSYLVTIMAFSGDSSTATRTMNLTVEQAPSCPGTEFKQAPAFAVGTNPQSVVAEDFDGDGKYDLATANLDSQNTSVIRNTSAGGSLSFAPKVDFAGGATGIAAADLDGDGKKDIIATNSFTSNISVLRNTSSGVGNINFASRVDSAVQGSPRSLTTADVDGDGKLDVIVANFSSNSVSVVRNTSSGAGVVSFDPAINLVVGSGPRSVVAADLDNDGKVDIVSANFSASTLSILRNTSVGPITFAPKIDFSTGQFSSPTSVTAADFNDDGKLDLGVADNALNRALFVRNSSSGQGVIGFAAPTSFVAGFFSVSIVAADMDADGKMDAAVTGASGTVSALRNISSGTTFNFELRREFGARLSPTQIAAKDLDGDGLPDLAVSNGRSNAVSILRNTRPAVGSLRFDTRSEFALNPNVFHPFSVAVGDIDRDGRQDLVTANNGSGNISVFKNISPAGGTTSFAPGLEFVASAFSTPYSVAVQDLDGDGKQDVVVVLSSPSSLLVLRNTTVANGGISFASALSFPVGLEPTFVTSGDFDRDGKHDVVVANTDSDNVSVLRNLSSGAGSIAFAPSLDLMVNSDPTSIAIDDFNGDGKLDLAVTNKIGTTISVFRNSSEDGGPITFAPKVDFTVSPQPTSVVAEDLDSDGKPDLAATGIVNSNGFVSVLRNTSASGSISFAPKVDFQVTSNTEFAVIPGSLVTGELNGDGKSDLAFLNLAVYAISILRNSSTGPGSMSFLPRTDTYPSYPTAWLAIGDFERDGRQDLAFSSYNINNVGVLPNPCTVARGNTFDFDGDGKTDIGIFRPNVAEWWINRSSNGLTFATQFGATTDKIVPADYTGDGKADVAFWRPASGDWFVLRSEDFSFFAFPFGTNGDIPVPADYDADGKSDAAVFRPSSATWFVRRSSDGGTTIEAFGANSDLPVPADYDGDGKADLAIFRPSNGQWWLNRSTAGVIATSFGDGADKPVQGDYTGDGKSDVAFWRPTTGDWFVLRSEDFSFFSFPFGTTGDIPAPGDYDGDGRHDATVFRESNATWYSQRTTAGTLIQQFGAVGDRPIPNAFVP